jgi:hypothetical protein
MAICHPYQGGSRLISVQGSRPAFAGARPLAKLEHRSAVVGRRHSGCPSLLCGCRGLRSLPWPIGVRSDPCIYRVVFVSLSGISFCAGWGPDLNDPKINNAAAMQMQLSATLNDGHAYC